MSERLQRQLNIINPEEFEGKIIIAGAGGIGSTLSLILTKMGFKNIHIFDDDTVEEHNIASQMYDIQDLGRLKTDRIETLLTIHKEDHQEIKGYAFKFPSTEVPITISEKDIICVCVDSMEARKNIWEFAKDLDWKLYIEGRMDAEIFKIYSVNQDSKEQYDTPDILYSDEEATEGLCTARAVAYNTFTIGGFMSSIVKKAVKEEQYPFELGVDLINYQIIQTKHD